MKLIRKLRDDTLKKDGVYSRKSLTTFVSFVNAIIIGWIIVFATKGTVNVYAISVFYGFLGLGGGTLALTVIDKIRNRNEN
jgi:hypothetical protein